MFGLSGKYARSCRAATLAAGALLASACTDQDDRVGAAPTPALEELSGTAAVGAPIAGGSVTAKCGGGLSFAGTTGSDGSFRIVDVPRQALPCALRVSGGTVDGVASTRNYHSFAAAAGVVNLTPLTDLAVAAASGMDPQAWFEAIGAAQPPRLAAVATALATLLERLAAAGYEIPAALDPFTTAFVASVTNSYDALLEALAAGLAAADMEYAELLSAVAADPSGFTPPPPDTDPGTGGGGDTPNGDTVAGSVNAALAGSYTLIYHQENPGAPFADQAEVPVVIGADGRLQIDGKTLDNPFFRSFGGTPNDAEVIWLDADKQFEYALSNNREGHFNEINVGDASAPVTDGIPRFLGQLRMPETGGGIPAELAPLAGSYAPLALRKSGEFGSYTIGNAVPVVIDGDTGVVTVDGKFVFDPADEGYSFFPNLNSTAPAYIVNSTHSDGDPISVYLFIEADELVGFRLEKSHQISDGVFSTASLYLELRPLPENLTTFFNDAVAATPVVLTVVRDDTAYNSGYTLCQQIRLSSFLNGSGDSQSFTYFLHQADDSFIDQEVYSRADTRYLENSGNRILQFLRNRISLRADGFVDVTAVFAGTDKDRATNDPAQIAAACPAP